jgi:hypothetical protein
MLRRVLHATLAGAVGVLMLLGVGALTEVKPQGPSLPHTIPAPDIGYINDSHR